MKRQQIHYENLMKLNNEILDCYKTINKKKLKIKGIAIMRIKFNKKKLNE
jgi:hypothetical protein